jgi:hypothetical protein
VGTSKVDSGGAADVAFAAVTDFFALFFDALFCLAAEPGEEAEEVEVLFAARELRRGAMVRK